MSVPVRASGSRDSSTSFCKHAGIVPVRDLVDLAFLVAVAVAALTASGHAVIHKRDSRSAAIWLLLIWILPALGPVLYALLGVNRVERRAAPMPPAMLPPPTHPPFPPRAPRPPFTP